MGMFDFRCSVSGLSLNRQRTVLILVLEVAPDRWVPVSLALRGEYDSYGTIDGVKPDFRTAFLASDFHQLAKSGRLASADSWASEDLKRLKALAQPALQPVLKVLERGTTGGVYEPHTLTVDGKRLRQTMILRELFDGVVGKNGAPPRPEPAPAAVTALLEQTFESELGRWLVRDLPKTPGPMRAEGFGAINELRVFRAWLERLALPWLPSNDSAQHSAIHALAYYPVARARLAADEAALKVVDTWARREQKTELEDDNYYQLPAKWLLESARSWYGLAIGSHRFAATDAAGLRTAIERQVIAPGASALLGAGPELFTVQRGVPTQRIDLRTLVRITDGTQRVTLADPAAARLASAGARVQLNWDEIELQLQPLQTPLASSTEALYPLLLNGAVGPAWVREDEQHRDTIARFKLGSG